MLGAQPLVLHKIECLSVYHIVHFLKEQQAKKTESGSEDSPHPLQLTTITTENTLTLTATILQSSDSHPLLLTTTTQSNSTR